MRKIGKTVIFDKPPKIIGHAGVAGKKEGEGPLAKDFDMIFEDTTMGQQSYELAESAMLHDAIIRSLSNAGVAPSSVDFVLSGDLLNQCMGSAFALKDLEIPSIGLFGACSTMAPFAFNGRNACKRRRFLRCLCNVKPFLLKRKAVSFSA